MDSLAEKLGFDGLLYKCRDHCGPWGRGDEIGLDIGSTMNRAKCTLNDDIDSGWDFAHIDTTIDPYNPKPLRQDIVLERSAELLKSMKEKLPYELGMDEINGTVPSGSELEEFIKSSMDMFEGIGLHMPTLISAQTGTLVKMDRNVGRFTKYTKELVSIASKYGIGFREHNTDYSPVKELKHRPDHGVSVVSVAPELGVTETKALLDLSDMESGYAYNPGFFEVLSKKVIKSNRWKKWLSYDEKSWYRESIISDPSKIRKVTEIAGHYFFADPEVRNARSRLEHNLP